MNYNELKILRCDRDYLLITNDATHEICSIVVALAYGFHQNMI